MHGIGGEGHHGLGDLRRVEGTRHPESALTHVARGLPGSGVDDGRSLRQGGQDLRRVGVVVAARAQRRQRGGGASHPPVGLVGADGGQQSHPRDASGARGQVLPATPLPDEHEACVPQALASEFKGIDENLGGQPVGDRARVDEDGTGAGGKSCGKTGGHGLGHAHAVGDDGDAGGTQLARAAGHPVGHGDDAASAPQREGFQRGDCSHDRARHTGQGGGVGNDVRTVIHVGDAPDRARQAHGRAGCGRRFGDNHVRARPGQQPRDKRHVKRQIGHVPAHRPGAVAQHGRSPYLDEAVAALVVSCAHGRTRGRAAPRAFARGRRGGTVRGSGGVAGDAGGKPRGEDAHAVSTGCERPRERPEAQGGGGRFWHERAGREGD